MPFLPFPPPHPTKSGFEYRQYRHRIHTFHYTAILLHIYLSTLKIQDTQSQTIRTNNSSGMLLHEKKQHTKTGN